MNAAARAINQGSLFNGQLFEIRLSRPLCWVLTLLFAVLLSALSVIYVTNEHRLSNSELQQLEQQKNQLQLQWGQLLLEQASLGAPGRVEAIATGRLNMHLPTDKQAYVLQNP